MGICTKSMNLIFLTISPVNKKIYNLRINVINPGNVNISDTVFSKF